MKKICILSLLYFVFTNYNLMAQIINIPADYPTIQQGINASQDGDTVIVQPGTYKENIVFNGKSIVVASTFLLTQDTNAIAQTIIDGQWWDEVVTMNSLESSDTYLTGFSIINGNRGINISQSNANVSYCWIYNNIAAENFGGGIRIESSPGYDLSKISHCKIYNNSCNDGAGICVRYHKGVIEHCQIYNNIGVTGSQIIFTAYSETTLKNCLIKDERDFATAVVTLWNANPILMNNLLIVSINYASGQFVLGATGGSSMVLINNTFINNGIQGSLSIIGPPAHIAVYNSIAEGLVMADSMGYTSAYSRFDNIPDGEGNINTDPLLNADYSLSNCSPCIGAGTLSFAFNDSTYYAPDIDYLYSPRPQPIGSNPDMGAFENALGVPLIPPAITLHPVGTSRCEGESYTLQVEATGSPELLYQWQKNNVNIEGETSNVLQLEDLIPSDEANYRCLVTNSCETKYSNQAFVEVKEAPEVSSQPQDVILYFGNDVTFAVSSTGDEPMFYQWYGPSGLMEDDTLAQLIISGVSTADVGNYYCTITNMCGSVTSNYANLTAYEQLTVNAGTDVGIILGDSTQLNGSYSGGSPSLTIQWTPDSLLYEPNILNPQTLALFSSQAFALTINDLQVGYQIADEVIVTVIEDDTLGYGGGYDTLYQYFNPSFCGYVSGNNCELDKIKANYFTDEIKSYDVDKVLLRFGKAYKTSIEEVPVKIGIWAKSSENDKPGELVDYVNVPLSQIVQDVTDGKLTTVEFPTTIAVPKDFFVGVFLPTTAGDTLALMTTVDRKSESGTGWTLTATNEWISYPADPRYFLRLSNAIFPVVKQNNVGINDFVQMPGNLRIYPNPAKDILNIQFEEDDTDAEISIFDIQGKSVVSEKINKGKTLFNIGNLNPGVYIIKININQNYLTRKLIVY